MKARSTQIAIVSGMPTGSYSEFAADWTRLGHGRPWHAVEPAHAMESGIRKPVSAGATWKLLKKTSYE
jgi:hypothetical protein